MKLVRKIALAALVPLGAIAVAMALAPSEPSIPSLAGWLVGFFKSA